MNAAPATIVRPVTITAGLFPAEVEAAHRLHLAYAAEVGCDFDAEAWAREIAAGVGGWMVAIAWDGDEPVGVTEMHVEYDALLRQRVAWGRRAYVLPEYRREDVFTALFQTGIDGCQWLGIPIQRAVAANDWYGHAMKRFYESRGFAVVGTIMERR